MGTFALLLLLLLHGNTYNSLSDYSNVFCKSCEPEIVFVLICTLAEQFHVQNLYKQVNEQRISCQILV